MGGAPDPRRRAVRASTAMGQTPRFRHAAAEQPVGASRPAAADGCHLRHTGGQRAVRPSGTASARRVPTTLGAHMRRLLRHCQLHSVWRPDPTSRPAALLAATARGVRRPLLVLPQGRAKPLCLPSWSSGAAAGPCDPGAPRRDHPAGCGQTAPGRSHPAPGGRAAHIPHPF